MQIEEILTAVAQRIVDYPEEVAVEVQEAGNMTVYVLYVDERDRGKIIGKRGRTADSLRALMMAFTGKDRRRYLLEIVQ